MRPRGARSRSARPACSCRGTPRRRRARRQPGEVGVDPRRERGRPPPARAARPGRIRVGGGPRAWKAAFRPAPGSQQPERLIAVEVDQRDRPDARAREIEVGHDLAEALSGTSIPAAASRSPLHGPAATIAARAAASDARGRDREPGRRLLRCRATALTAVQLGPRRRGHLQQGAPGRGRRGSPPRRADGAAERPSATSTPNAVERGVGGEEVGLDTRRSQRAGSSRSANRPGLSAPVRGKQRSPARPRARASAPALAGPSRDRSRRVGAGA